MRLIAGARRRLATAIALLSLATPLAVGCSGRDAPSTSVLLITIDTCRDDHVGAARGGGSLTPSIDELAAEGRRVRVAVSPSCFTAPAMTSLATGVYPETHGVLQWGIDGASYGRPGLGARFRAAGYATAFVSGHGGLAPILPLTSGFDFVRDLRDEPAPAVTRLAVEWLERTRRDRPNAPVFLWVHYFDPHSPYSPPEPFARSVLGGEPFERWVKETLPRLAKDERDRALEALYAGEVRAVDRAIGDLLPAVRRVLPRERLVVALTADHGENLSDHEPNYAHHDVLYDSLVRVPLVLAGPGARELPLDSDVPVETLRLAPTLLDLAGIEYAPGEYVQPSLLGGAGNGFAYCHSGFQDAPHAALRSAAAKVVVDLATGRKEAFDLIADPEERRPLDPEASASFRDLSRGLDELRREMTARAPVADAASALPDDLRSYLESLGYLRRAIPAAAPAERTENK